MGTEQATNPRFYRGSVPRTFTLDAETVRRIDVLARMHDVRLSQAVRALLAAGLAEAERGRVRLRGQGSNGG